MSRWPRFSKIKSLLIGVALLLWAGPVLAHAVLVNADPAPNSIVNTAPAEVWILFSEPIEPAFSQIQVFSQSGQPVDTGDLTPANEDNTAMLVTLPPLSDGTYLVNWRVLSTVDGHTTSGTFPFGVGLAEISGELGTVSASATQPTPYSAGGRWLILSGVTLLVGLFTFRLLVWQPLLGLVRLDDAESGLEYDFGRYSLRIGFVCLLLLASGSLLTFISQATQVNLLDQEFSRIWLGTRFGSMWFIRSGLTLLGAVYFLYLWRGWRQHRLAGWAWWAGLALSLGLALTVSLVSHSAALTGPDAWLALTVDVAHLLAAGIWAGGLLQLGLVLSLVVKLPAKSRSWLSWGLILNFSTLAAGAVGVLLLSGGYLGWQHIGSWTLLFGTAYGLTLATKIGLALPAFALAAVNLLILKPRLHQALDPAGAEANRQLHRRFGRIVLGEMLLALLVVAAAGYLTDLQRGVDAPLLTEAAGQVIFEQTADDITANLNLTPALVGQNTFELRLQDAAGQPISATDEVSLRFTFLGQSMGTATVEATQLGAGQYQVEGGYVSLVGPWQIEVVVRRPGTFDTFIPFRLEAGLNGSIRALGNETFLEQLTKFLTQSGGSVTGALLIVAAVGWVVVAKQAAKHDWQLVPLLLPGFVALWLGGFQIYIFYSEFTPAKFTTNPVLPDGGSVSRGQQLYEANCVACHGFEGRGDGELAADYSPPPVDFTAGHTDTHPDGDLYFWIKEGIEGSAMPAFGEQLSDDDIWNLVNYVRRLSAS